jgi:ribonuclease VapC
VIVVDTSAVIAVLCSEDDSDAVLNVLLDRKKIYMSVASVLEASIVCRARYGTDSELDALLQTIAVSVESVDLQQLTHARLAYARYGKGRGHQAQLNFGDCFSYALAKALGMPLLFKGNDFGHTDVVNAQR